MKLVQGAVPYPATVDAAPVRQFASLLRSIAGRLEGVDDTVDRAAKTASDGWTGDAATTFSHHMNDRGHAFELGAARVREAAEALEDLAAVIDRTQRSYASAVDAEHRAESRRAELDRDEAIQQELTAVMIVMKANADCSNILNALTELLDAYASRSFVAVGDDQVRRPFDPNLSGRDLLIDSLLATDEKIIAPDEIQIRRLDDGSYIVVLPGVTDLSNNVTTPWKWVTGGPQDTARKVANAQPSVIWNGSNTYADAVKIALQRAGVPPGSVVTFVGHSYGSYTAIDLARDDDFNSIDGTSKGYNVRVKNVFGFGADVDWKMARVPKQTNVVALNSRDDVVYQAEARVHPELAEIATDLTTPWMNVVPRPQSVDFPSYRSNQVEVVVNAGRRGGDDHHSGHHPANYAEAVPRVGRTIDALYDRLGNGRIVEVKNVRVPDGPKDIVPPPAR